MENLWSGWDTCKVIWFGSCQKEQGKVLRNSLKNILTKKKVFMWDQIWIFRLNLGPFYLDTGVKVPKIVLNLDSLFNCVDSFS